VLVVDDDLPVARALERWLKRRGVMVFLVTEASEFEQSLERDRPTLVISDYLMPKLNGVQVLATAKRLAPDARRCLLSGSLEQVTAAQRASISPCLFLEKPWDPARLAIQLGLSS
jgi:DNA-binding NtrC family response regulator